MTSQAISGNFAKLSNFTEFYIVLYSLTETYTTKNANESKGYNFYIFILNFQKI